jgi:DNA-3-methyladenine glycosylase I
MATKASRVFVVLAFVQLFSFTSCSKDDDVAAYTEEDRERLLSDPGIIRNKLKVNAAIENAKTIIELQKEFGSFEKWLEHHHPKDLQEWMKLFKKTFKFTGGEIVNEFLMSIGYLKGAHSENCAVYKNVLKQKPMWKSE